MPLLKLAAEVARSAAQDYPAVVGPNWTAAEGVAWDAERISADIGVPRLATLGTTAMLLDAVLASIDRIDGPNSVW